ncbi:nitroreductase family protein [Dysgonomonas sp. 216]|uniref:nitroreductase family protein n=1 Tax=Dysgonomonas sp. 216 TaxID=2302934 RepID=UPI0013CFB01E|nr:nitroreductase family protein [Dysgonomonas sp. 216]NDW18492.1 nitroreductase family protein [Dysgonomonas sp. 216]
MTQLLKEAIKNRRSYYALSNESTISDKDIENLIEYAIKHIPSAFNSQTTRIVLLLGDNHKKLWDIVKNVLKDKQNFANTEAKINTSFASGHGTILFFEDQDIVKGLQQAFPSYSDNFPLWSVQTSAMHQFAIWTMLRDAGMGASLQHYNPLIDEDVKNTWNLNPSWQLIAQMPFGKPLSEPDDKEHLPVDERIKVFK